jgi:hypothetical protein
LLQKDSQRGIWSCFELTDLYDVFKPTYLKVALGKFPYLEYKVFGKLEWLAMDGKLGDNTDPLSVYFMPVIPQVRPKDWKCELSLH